MKSCLAAALFASSMLAACPCAAGQAPVRRRRVGHPGQPRRPRLCRRAVLQHCLGDRSGVQPAAGRDPPGRSAAGQFQPALPRPVLVHGMGFSPDRKTIAVVSIGSNSVTFIDTATNRVLHTTYVGRSPHEAFFTQDGREVWVTVRGEDYVAVLDAKTFEETGRIKTPGGPGMTIFSPDGRYGYVCSSFIPRAGGGVRREDPRRGGPRGAAQSVLPEHRRDARRNPGLVHPEGHRQDRGDQRPAAIQHPDGDRHRPDHQPRQLRRHRARPLRLRPRSAGWTRCRVFRRDTFEKVATIPVGHLPHGVWPSGRRDAGLCRPGEPGRHGRDRHRDQHRHRHHPDRPGRAGGDLCARRGPQRRWPRRPAAAGPGWRGGARVAGSAGRAAP